jgi:iron(III) transport system substrate-binding protein
MMTRRPAIGSTFGLLAASLVLYAAPASAQDLSTRFADLYKAASREGKVVYYNEGREAENARLAALWKQNFPNVKLIITAKQTMSLIPMIETERAAGHGRADVVTITEPFITAKWKKLGYFASYKTQTYARLAPEWVDADGVQYVNSVSLMTGAYNTRAISDKNALPKNLAGFQDPKWQGKIVLADPKTAGSNLTYFFTLEQTHRLKLEDLAPLKSQNILWVRGNAEATNLLAAGERTVSPMISSQNLLNARAHGQPVDFFALDEGSVEIRRTTSIFKNAPEPNAARLLLEVLTTPEQESATSEAGGYWPTHPDATTPPTLPKLASLKPVVFDLDTDEAESAAFVQRFNGVFGRE